MIPLPPAPPGAFCAPTCRRDPGRSPAALRAASADFRPLRRASRPSGLRPASPHPLRALPLHHPLPNSPTKKSSAGNISLDVQ